MDERTEEARSYVAQIAERHADELQSRNLRQSLNLHVQAWADPAHALLEILQNADDAGPSGGKRSVSIEFRFSESGLTVQHDGREFSGDDMRGISSIGDTKKSAEKHIGFMGIGFKSVYKFAAAAYVVSGPYSFCFLPQSYSRNDHGWILVPTWCDRPPVTPLRATTTTLYFPYLREVKGDVRSRLESALVDELPAVCLLFLRHVSEIRVLVGDETRRTLVRRGLRVEDTVGGERRERTFRVFRKRFTVPKECKEEYRVAQSGRDQAKAREVTVVFETGPQGNLLRMDEKSSFFAFLPTEQAARLPFVVQCDFILDAQRAFIDQALEWNAWLLRSAADVLLAEAISAFRRDKLTKYQFFEALPSPDREADDFVKRHMLEPFWERCRASRIVPSRGGKWLLPSEAITASELVQHLVDDPRLEAVTGRKGYVHLRTRGRQVLHALGVDSFRDAQIVDVLGSPSWLRSKPRKWFKDLYAFLREWKLRERWGTWSGQEERLSSLKIVPMLGGGLAAPSEALFPPQARRRQEKAAALPGLRLVSPVLAKGASRDFLADLGVQDFSDEEIIRRALLPQISMGKWTSWNRKGRNHVLDFLRRWLRSLRWRPPEDLTDSLASVPLPAQDRRWYPAKDLYLRNAVLERIVPKARWVAQRRDGSWERFVVALGVSRHVRLVHDDDQRGSTQPPRGAARWYEYWWGVLDPLTGSDHRVAGAACLPYLDMRLSKARVRALAEMIAAGWSDYYSRFRSSYHHYFYYRARRSRVDSYFAWQLGNAEWLPTTGGLRRPTGETFVPTPQVQRTYGKLPTYVALPKETIGKAHDLWELLGLSTEVAPEATVNVLAAASQQQPGSAMKNQLSRMYAYIGRLIAGLIDEQGEEALESWREALSRSPLLTESGDFVSARGPRVLWADDRPMASLFDDFAKFIWFPRDVERAVISTFLEACAVEPLSKGLTMRVDRAAVKSSRSDDQSMSRLRARADLLFSCVAHKSPGSTEQARRILRKLAVRRCEAVSVVCGLDGVERTTLVNAFMDPERARVYLGSAATHFDIALELCRVLGLDREFADTLESMVRLSRAQAVGRLEQVGIASLTLERREHGKAHDEDEEVVSAESPEAFEFEDEAFEETLPEVSEEEEAAAAMPSPVGPQTEKGRRRVGIEAKGNEAELANGFVPEAVGDLPPLSSVTIAAAEHTPGAGGARARRSRRLRAEQAIKSAPAGGSKISRSPDVAGDRAEEIVNLLERDRLTRLGQNPDDALVWVSARSPQADHDFESVDDGGKTVYVEVKAATGGGAFRWTRNEMTLARKQRRLYWLYLVYGATTTRARPVLYRDPIGLWEDGEIDLDFEVLIGRAPVPEEGVETKPPEGDLQAREDLVDTFEGGPVHQFVDDEDGYLKWLVANPGGFVINSYRRPRANYLMLHQATCSTVSGDPAKGRLWTSGYSKTCATTREQLERWAEREVGGRAILCERCRP